MRKFVPASDPMPIGAINVTPFIDGMLVLLIVMILSIPVMTHKVPVDLPQGDPGFTDNASHRLAIDKDGALSLEFNTEGMFRGARDSKGRREIAIY